MGVEYYPYNDLNTLHNWSIIDRLFDNAHVEKMAEVTGNLETYIQSLEHWRDTALQLSKNNGENCKKINELEADLLHLREAQRWISVGERLPEGTQRIFVMYMSGAISVATKFGNGELRTIGLPAGWESITHWMPLPPVPEDADAD
jgi:hypothetical protein